VSKTCIFGHLTSPLPTMPTILDRLLQRWHRLLGLHPQIPPSWYRQRLREELRERREAESFWGKLSETSDVFFSASRAAYDGFPVHRVPSSVAVCHSLPIMYMFAKYTSRWAFYRTAARICRCSISTCDSMREVVNPSKDHKLLEVAARYQVDSARFLQVARKLRQFWPLLP
jgi:hypothetical protein